MKICAVVLGRPDTTQGGVELTLWKISKELVKLGCNIHVVFDRTTSSECPSDFTVDGVHLYGVNKPSRFALYKALSFKSLAYKKLEEINAIHDMDLFTFHGSYSLLPLISFRRHVPKPFVYHTYGALLYEAQTHLFKISSVKLAPNFLRKSLMYMFYTPLEFLALKYLNNVIVASLLSANELIKYYCYPKNRVSVAPLGQDIFERYGRKVVTKGKHELEGKKVLLFVGNDWFRKGVWYLLLAFKEVINKVPNTILIITGPPQEPFLSLIKKLKLESSVLLAGNVDEETLAEYYALCDVFVLPSFHEGFSNTIIEAMAFGKPVVTTPIAGYPVVEDGKDGFIVQPDDYKSIAASMAKLLSDERLYREMGRNASRKAKKYTWKESAKKILKIYNSLY
ncbi:MAG: glycosyltransferase family 4 protein [Candidatus Lokiarchaeia archaeon]